MAILYLLCQWAARAYLRWEAAAAYEGCPWHHPLVYNPSPELPPEFFVQLFPPRRKGGANA